MIAQQMWLKVVSTVTMGGGLKGVEMLKNSQRNCWLVYPGSVMVECSIESK